MKIIIILSILIIYIIYIIIFKIIKRKQEPIRTCNCDKYYWPLYNLRCEQCSEHAVWSSKYFKWPMFHFLYLIIIYVFYTVILELLKVWK